MSHSHPAFIHLRLHSEFSLEDGIVRVGDLAARCKALSYPAAAITDISNLYATIKLYKAFQGNQLKPIIGAELWVQYSDDPKACEKLVFLAENNQGYVELCQLISRAYLDNHHDTYVAIMFDWLDGQSENLIALSGGPQTILGQHCIRQNLHQAINHAKAWQKLMPSRYFVELQRLGHDYEPAYEATAIAMAAELKLPVVATNDVRFINKEDFDAHEVRYCINNGYKLEPEGKLTRPRPYTPEQYLKTPEEMQTLFADIPQALDNTVTIAQRCNVTLELDQPVLPAFDIPGGQMSEAEYLRHQSQQGLEERLKQCFPDEHQREANRARYQERLDIELDTIISMGFPGYFLIVADFIQWAKDQSIPVGPGRGSGAGSLVAFALKITNLDPLPYDLLFERFLNPERVSMPDFDIDFCMDQRDDVIQYVADKYGKHRVSQIATHGSMMARAVVRDVGRAMGYAYGPVDRIAKLIPGKPGTKLRSVMLGRNSDDEKLAKEYAELYEGFADTIDDLHDRYERDEDDIKQLIDMALRLEGIARNVGKHAGGVVIAPSALTDFSPLYCDVNQNGLVTQYDKDDVESAGLVKFDFLGLRTLTILDWAVQSVNENRLRNGEEPIDLDLLALDDPKPYELIRKANTTAVFQLESPGMKRLITRLKPENFEEIVALVALYRPGPLDAGMTDDFINRKHGLAKVEYLHPALTDMLRPILEPTYGVIVYQEQVMQIAQVMANFSLGGADLLRRAMGKKKAEEMEKQKSLFVAGAKENGIDEGISTYVFDSIEKFAGYGFNKSHSAGYALVAYHTAWLKAYYPAEFMAAVLSSDMDKTDKVVTFLEECHAMQINIIPPDVNRSFYKFVPVNGEIIFGMGAIKGVGENVIAEIIKEREANGPYQDLFELCQRLPHGTVNKKSLEALTYSGALDQLGTNRHSIHAALAEAMKLADQHHKDASSGQAGLFGGMDDNPITSPTMTVLPEWPSIDKLNHEKNALGLFLTGHPINDYETLIEKLSLDQLADLNALTDDTQQLQALRKNPKSVLICGYALSVQRRSTKSGNMMTLVKIDDRSAQTELRWFDDGEQPSHHVAEGDIVIIEAKLSYNAYQQELRYDIKNILPIDKAQEQYCRGLKIQLDSQTHTPQHIDQLYRIVSHYQGGHAGILLQYQHPLASAQFRLGERWTIKPSTECVDQITNLLGDQYVSISYRTRSVN